jgi:protoporphyrinogen oxidase
MSTHNENILIIGAGAAGLACAMELSKNGHAITIVEKDTQVGGLAQTLTFQEGENLFRTDIGPHRFFSKNQYLYDFIEDLIP